MDFLTQLFGKNSSFEGEYKRFKKAMGKNPGDHGLKAQFIKSCLLNRFSGEEINPDHITEALALFETVANTDAFDLQCHYLVGKYYQEERNVRKAYRIYLNAIKRFNEHVGDNPEAKGENAELAYSISLNIMALQSNPIDPEIEKCFKIIRKSFPLHVKRIELENEMAKPAPDQARVKQLAQAVRQLKAEEDKEIAAGEAEQAANPTPVKMSAKTAEKTDIFTRLLNNPIPIPKTASFGAKTEALIQKEEKAKNDSLKLSPVADATQSTATFMVHLSKHWEGPYTPAQLKAMDLFKPATWVCRSGSQQVLQAYEVPELMALFQQHV